MTMRQHARQLALQTALLAILPGLAWPQAAQPCLFFSDIVSGPNSGGQNNAGAFVTLYGTNFGANPAVTAGGGQAVITLPPASYLWYQKMTIQLGSLAQSGNIVVTNSNGSSNPLPFTVRPGNIYFVTTDGDDSNAGTSAAPWKTLSRAVQASGAGDIVYAMNGVSQTGDDGQNWDASLTLRAEFCQGTAASPKALVAYPGATVTIGNPSEMSPGHGLRSTDFTAGGGACGGNWVFAGLNFRGVSPVAINGPSTNWRFIGNDISNPQADGGGGGGATWEVTMATYVKCLGNYGHDLNLATTDRLQQGFYPSTDSNHTELGWNEIGNVGGRAAIQIHSSPVSSGNGYAMFDLSIHDNRIHDVAGEGIIIDTVDPSQGPVQVYNNVIWNTGRTQGGNAIYGATSSDFDTSHGVGSGYVDIFNNTIYDWKGGAGIGTWYEVHNGQALYYRVRDNLLVSTGQPYWDPWKSGPDSEWRACTASDTPSTCPHFTGSNNLVFGNGAATFTALLTSTVNSDPLLVNLSQDDFHLQSGSPAANGGTATPQTTDIDGVPLPQGSGYSIGAYALAGGGGAPVVSVVSVSVSPNSANLSGGQAQQFTATVSGTSNTAVTWSLNPAVGTISSSGLYTAPTSISAQQTVTVTATSDADATKSASATVTLVPPTGSVNLPPVAVSVTPSSGSGTRQTFSFVYSDPNGYADLAWAQVNINSVLSATNACYLHYDRAFNAVWLFNDEGTAWLAPVTLGSSDTVLNSQCGVNGAGSSASGSDNNLTLNLDLSFLPAFAGSKTVSMRTQNIVGLESGWQARGTWTVVGGNGNEPPSAVSVTPSSGSGTSQTFSFVYSDPNGYADLPWAEVNINSVLSATNACYLHYDQAFNVVWLLNDEGTAWLGPVTLGSSDRIRNGQCRVNGTDSSASGSGNNLTLNLDLRFRWAFTGSQTVYMRTQNIAGVETGWQAKGSWTTP